MKSIPIVALIGQTNAGKSSLLNRFARKNLAIVAREEGTTRDNVTARIDDRFLLIDTAGLKDPTDSFEAGIQDQIADAIDSAALILLTLDSSKYPDQRDRDIAKQALKSRKPVFLLLNKSDLGAAPPPPDKESPPSNPPFSAPFPPSPLPSPTISSKSPSSAAPTSANPASSTPSAKNNKPLSALARELPATSIASKSNITAAP